MIGLIHLNLGAGKIRSDESSESKDFGMQMFPRRNKVWEARFQQEDIFRTTEMEFSQNKDRY